MGWDRGVLPASFNERLRTLNVSMRGTNDRTTEGRHVGPPEGGLVHCRSAKWLASAGVKAKPYGRPAAGLDIGSSMLMIAFSVVW